MLILLPPSEGKAAPATGPRLDLDRLCLPRLTDARRVVLDALVSLCRDHPERAPEVLGLSARQAPDVARNAVLRDAPAAPAVDVYTGVLFSALAPGTLAEPERARLLEWVLVWSGLWGAVRLADPIPAYRLPGGVTLPGAGRLARYWRDPLHDALAEPTSDGTVLDLRSAAYSASWTGPPERTLVARVVHERAGSRTVASHFNKAAKGRLVRALARASGGATDPADADDLVDAIRAAGFRAEPESPAPRRRPRRVDLIVDTL